MSQYTAFLDTAVAAARAAGALARSMQDSLKEIRFKGEKDVVTEADLACDAAIRKILSSAHPDHDIVTEETDLERRGARHVWFVDPLDGTTNFAHGYSVFCASVSFSSREMCAMMWPTMRCLNAPCASPSPSCAKTALCQRAASALEALTV